MLMGRNKCQLWLWSRKTCSNCSITE